MARDALGIADAGRKKAEDGDRREARAEQALKERPAYSKIISTTLILSALIP